MALDGTKVATGKDFDATGAVIRGVVVLGEPPVRGLASALGRITAPLTVVGIDSDRLFPVRLQQELVDLTPGADYLHILHSPYGHDGFLVEDEQVGVFFDHALNRVRRNDPR